MTDFQKNLFARRTVLASLGLALSGSVSVACAAQPRSGGDTEGKFDADGDVRPWAGDTIICPLPIDSPAFAAMLQINVEVTRHFRNYVAATPPASYHMTIYGCADPQRRAAHWWPTGVAPDAAISQVDTLILDRLRSARFEYSLPIRMRVDPGESFPATTALPLLPADTRQRDELYALREAIARQIGLMTPNVDTFRFHMTFGYPFRAMPPAVAEAFRDASLGWRRQLARQLDIIELPAPVYCRFGDMFAFEPLLTLPNHR